MFPKRQTLRKPHVSHTPPKPQAHHAYHSTHIYATYAHHTHTHHALLYAKMYSSTYFGRKGHLIKFCYDRINVLNDHVWVLKTNTLGLKKIWVSKLTPLLIDIGTHQGSKM